MKSLRSVFGGGFVFSAVALGNLVVANPVGESVVGGAASFDRTRPGRLTINQMTDRLIINWNDFSIGRGETTSFLQPSVTSIAVNRVLAGNPSKIYGNLEANGIVYLINPNGILVGPSGTINTRSFIGSTLDAPDSSFMAGTKLTLSGNSDAAVINQGTIEAIGGDVFLVGRSVENSGTIRANSGTVGLGAGSEVMLVPAGNEKLSVIAGGGSAAIGVNNQGTIESVAAELKAAGGNIYALAINNGGIVRATGVRNEGGRVFLTSDGGDIQNSGTISANNEDGSGGSIKLSAGHNADNTATVISTGTLSARGDAAGTRGGEIQVLGDRVGLVGEALVDVSGDAGGGTALIGGDFQGKNGAVQNAKRTSVGPDAVIRADAVSTGDGGKVIVWADESTKFAGHISARGGVAGGDGGFAEVSGKEHLAFVGSADLSSPLGLFGTLLLDPDNITITDTADGTGTLDDELTPGSDPDLLFGVPNDGANTVSRGQLEAFGATANVVLSANDNITIDDLAGNVLNLAMTTGSITFTADANNDGTGDFSMNAGDTIRTQGGNVTINGVGITVGAIDTTPSTAIDGGSVTITSHGGGNVTVSGSITTTGGPVVPDANGRAGGNVSITSAGTLSVNDITTSGSDGADDGPGPLNRDGGNAGDVTLSAATGITLNGDIVALGGSGVGAGSDGAGGDLTFTATAGGINQTGGSLEAQTLRLLGAGVFDLDSVLNNVATLAANVDGALTYVDANALTIGTVAGTTGVTSADDAIAISTVNGALTINDTAAANDVDAGTATLSLTAGSSGNDNALTISGDVRGTGGIVLRADNVELNGGANSVDAGTGNITVRAFEANTAIQLRAPTDGAALLALSSTDLDALDSGSVTVGDSTAGTLTVNDDYNFGTANFNLAAGGDIIFITGATLTSSGSGALVSGGNITGAGSASHVDAAAVTLQTTGSGDIGSVGTLFHVSTDSLTASTAGAAGNDIFVREESGLTALNLNAGAGNAVLVVDAGTVADTDAAADITAATADVTLSAAFGTALNAVQTSVNSLTVDSGNGSQFITEANGLTALNLTAGSGDVNLTLTLGGLADVDASADITAANAFVTLSDATAQNVGASGNRIGFSVDGLSVSTAAGGGNQFLNEASGLTGLNLNAGVGAVDLTLTAGSILDTDGAADVTAATATIVAAGFGASGAGNAINTSVDSLNVNTSSGNGNQFITEANGLTALNLNAGSGDVNLALTLGGLADADGAADITAGTASITLSDATAQNVGAAGNRINTAVGGLSVDTSAGGGSQFVTEANGLTALNLNAGAGNVDLALTLGGLADADGAVDITAGTAVLTLSDATAQNAGSSGNRIGTSVNDLTVSTAAGGGDQFLTEANGLTGLNLNAGSGDVNLTLVLGAISDLDGNTDITAAGATLTLSDAAVQNVGSLGNPIATSVDSLSLNTAAGNGGFSIVEANGLTGLNLNLGTGSGILALSAGSLLDTDAATDITSGGTVIVQVTGAGNNIGSAANAIEVGGAAGSIFLSAAGGGVHVEASAGGGNDITFTSSTDNGSDITTEFTQGGKTYTVTYADAAGGDLTVVGSGNIPTPAGVTLLAPLGTLTLVANGQIGGGAGSPLIIDAATFGAVSGGNDISVFDTTGGLALSLVNAGAGDVNVTVQGGDLTSATVDGTADLVGDSVTLSVSGAGSTIGSSASSRLEINANTLTAANGGAAGDGIFVEDTAGGLAVAGVNAGAGAVNLNVVNGSLSSAVVDGSADIIGGNVTLAVSGAGSDIGVNAGSRLEVNATTLSASTGGAAGDDIFIVDTAGGLAAGLITAGLGNVDLSVLGGMLSSATVDGTADIVGDTVTLALTGGNHDIGVSAANRLELNAVTLNASTAGGGSIHVTDTAGGVAVDLVNAGTGNVNLNVMNGSLTSANVDGTADIVGATVNLAVTGAGSDIGASAVNRLEINAATLLNASTAGSAGDDVFILDTAGGLVAGLITAGSGDVNLLVQSGALIGDATDTGVADIVGDTVTLAVTGAGNDIGVSAGTRLEIAADTLNASTDGLAGENIFVVDYSGGLSIGTVDAGAGLAYLRAEGGNLISANVDGVADIVGSVVNLQVTGAGSRIGDSAANRLEIDATTSLIAEVDPTMNAGNDTDINIVDTSGGVAVEFVDAGGGDVNLRAINGNITSFVVDGNADLFGAAVTLSTTGGGNVGGSIAQPLEINAVSLGQNGGGVPTVGGLISVLDVAGGLTLNSMSAGGEVRVRSLGSEGLTMAAGNTITAGAGQNIVLSAESSGAPVENLGMSLNVSGGGQWFIYSTSPRFNPTSIISVGGILTFGGLTVNNLQFEKTLAANPPGTFPSGTGNMVFALPDSGEDFDEIAKFFGDFIQVEDYRAVSITFGDYDATKFGEVGDLWLSSSELYEEERKAGKAPRLAPEKVERMKFLIRGK